MLALNKALAGFRDLIPSSALKKAVVVASLYSKHEEVEWGEGVRVYGHL